MPSGELCDIVFGDDRTTVPLVTTQIRERWALPLTRFVIAVALGGLATAGLWRRFPDHLNITTDIIGNQIFSDFDVFRYIDGYYFIVGLFPLLVVAIYLVLSWKGPMRYRGPDRGAIFPLPSTREALGSKDLAAGRSFPRLGRSRTESTQSLAPSGPVEPAVHGTEQEDHGTLLITVFWTATRILLPALIIALELSIIQNRNRRVDNAIDFAGGVLYVLAVVLLAVALRAFFTPRAHSARLIASEIMARSAEPIQLTARHLGGAAALFCLPIHGGHHRSSEPNRCLPLAAGVARDRDHRHRLAGMGSSGTKVKYARSNSTISREMYLPGSSARWHSSPYSRPCPEPLDRSRRSMTPSPSPRLNSSFSMGCFLGATSYLIHGLLGDLFTGQIGMSLFGNTRWGSKREPTSSSRRSFGSPFTDFAPISARRTGSCSSVSL